MQSSDKISIDGLARRIVAIERDLQGIGMEVRAIQSARAQESDVSDLFGKMYKRLSHTIFTLVSVLESMPDTKMFARQLRLLAAGEDGEPTEDPADSFDED